MTNEIKIINELLKVIEDTTNTLRTINKIVAEAAHRNAESMERIKELTNEQTTTHSYSATS